MDYEGESTWDRQAQWDRQRPPQVGIESQVLAESEFVDAAVSNLRRSSTSMPCPSECAVPKQGTAQGVEFEAVRGPTNAWD